MNELNIFFTSLTSTTLYLNSLHISSASIDLFNLIHISFYDYLTFHTSHYTLSIIPNLRCFDFPIPLYLG